MSIIYIRKCNNKKVPLVATVFYLIQFSYRYRFKSLESICGDNYKCAIYFLEKTGINQYNGFFFKVQILKMFAIVGEIIIGYAFLEIIVRQFWKYWAMLKCAYYWFEIKFMQNELFRVILEMEDDKASLIRTSTSCITIFDSTLSLILGDCCEFKGMLLKWTNCLKIWNKYHFIQFW